MKKTNFKHLLFTFLLLSKTPASLGQMTSPESPTETPPSKTLESIQDSSQNPNKDELTNPNTELTDGPQVLEAPETPAPQTEAITTPKEENKTDEKEKSEKVSEALGPEINLDEVTDEKTKPQNKKNPNGEVVTEEELITPKNRPIVPKINSKKINESEIYISESSKNKIEDNFKSLKLNDVIEQGLRKNYDQGLRNQKELLSDLSFESKKNAFWLPNIKLTLSTNDQLISLIRKSSRASKTNNPKTPNGYIGLELGDYTFFNWGKDYALYLNTKENYRREKEIYNETKRELKLNFIYDYFNLVTTKAIEKIKQDQLRQASFIYRLSKEKLTIGKTSQQDYYQARSEYLRAQSEYHEARMQSDVADENMAFSITDDVGTKYIITEALEFKKIKLSLTDAITLANNQNPTLLNNRLNMENSERSYDVAQKENLPLPKFSINLGGYNKKFGTNYNRTTYETESGNGNIELVASINATWDIIGEDGLINSNKLAKSRINREIAHYEFDKNKHYTESIVRETYKNILNYQNQMLIFEARMPSMQKAFDLVLENYLNNKARYNDFHLALIDLTDTKIILEKIKLNHLKEKINLAKFTGVEDFPGENFEHLALKIKGK